MGNWLRFQWQLVGLWYHTQQSTQNIIVLAEVVCLQNLAGFYGRWRTAADIVTLETRQVAPDTKDLMFKPGEQT